MKAKQFYYENTLIKDIKSTKTFSPIISVSSDLDIWKNLVKSVFEKMYNEY